MVEKDRDLRNFAIKITYKDNAGSGIVFSAHNSTVVLTALHVLDNDSAISKEKLQLFRTINDYERNIVFEIKDYTCDIDLDCKNTYMVERAKEYGYKNAGLILDRGYFSTQNIRYFDQKGYDFLLMMKTGSKVLEEYLEEAILPLSTKTKYYLPNHNVYGLTRTGKLGDDMTVRYFRIYYDNIRASEEKNEYLKSLLEKEELLKKKVAEKIRRREDASPFYV